MKPTAEFCQHHEVSASAIDAREFRQGWRVKTRLDQLLLAGAIEPAEWMAAIAYRRLYERAFRNLWPNRSLDFRVAGGWRDRSIAAQLDALAAQRQLRQRLGPLSCRLIEACVLEDLSWAAIARQLGGMDPKTARTRTIAARRMLLVKI